MNKPYRPIVLLLTPTITVVLVSWLFIMHRDAVFCPLCWKEGMWLAKRWVEEKILFRPQETLCTRGRRCKANLVTLASAVKLYASDHEGCLPDHRYWEQQVFDYLRNSQIYRCPDAPVQQTHCYRMNPQLSGRNLKEIRASNETVLLFECDANGKPVARHHYLEFRHLCHVAFVDGHVEGLPPDEVFQKCFVK